MLLGVAVRLPICVRRGSSVDSAVDQAIGGRRKVTVTRGTHGTEYIRRVINSSDKDVSLWLNWSGESLSHSNGILKSKIAASDSLR